MISKKILKKAENLVAVVTDETDNTIEAVVGYPVTYFKKKERFVCGCDGDVLYGVPQCGHRIALVEQCKSIPEKFKEEVEREKNEYNRTSEKN